MSAQHLLCSCPTAGLCHRACFCASLQATSKRSDLLEFIQLESGVATLFDVRRNESYDASKSVDKLLSSAEVRNWMRATNQVGHAPGCMVPISGV